MICLKNREGNNKFYMTKQACTKANKTLERDQAYCAAFRKLLVQEGLTFYRSVWGLKAWPLSSPFGFKRIERWQI